MPFTLATWNINSVRLRAELVAELCRAEAPDILCLQECKSPVDKIPWATFEELGYTHSIARGQKGYNGVAILSRFPLHTRAVMGFCERQDARHISAVLGPEAGAAAGIVLHDFYVPAGGDVPDPAANDKFAHKLQFLDEVTEWFPAAQEPPTGIDT